MPVYSSTHSILTSARTTSTETTLSYGRQSLLLPTWKEHLSALSLYSLKSHDWTLYFPIHEILFSIGILQRYSFLFILLPIQHLFSVMNAHSLNMCSPSHSVYFPGQGPQYYGFNCHLQADNFQVFISNPKLTLEFLPPVCSPNANKSKSKFILFKSALPPLFCLSEMTST